MKTKRFTTKLTYLSFGVALIMVAGGCASVQKATSGERHKPDEFAVYAQPPLELPPDYGLRPPTPGAPRTQQGDSPRDQALETILSTTSQQQAPQQAPEGSSTGLQSLLKNTGALNTDPEIRRTINAELNNVAEEDEKFINKMIFWVDGKPYEGTVVDAEKEQKRILENQALGKPINEGEIPQITRERSTKGLLDF